MSFESDESVAIELYLYLDNTEPLYRKKLAIAANLLKKIKRGTYDHKQAPQAWSYVVEDAAKSYSKEHGTGSKREWADIFPPKIRRAVAEDLADRWYANVKDGLPDEV